MKSFPFAALALLGALCLSVPARADDNTANWVSQCRADRKPCRDSLGMAVVLQSGDFCAPKDMVMPNDAEVDGVLAWLDSHPQVSPDDWAEASDAALEALYPCSH